VLRAGSVAPAATLLLVVSSASGANDGIGADAHIWSTPRPSRPGNEHQFRCMRIQRRAFRSGFLEQPFRRRPRKASRSSSPQTTRAPPAAIPLSQHRLRPLRPQPTTSAPQVMPHAPAVRSSPTPPALRRTGRQPRHRLPVGSRVYPRGAWNESTATSVAASGGGVSTVIATSVVADRRRRSSARAGRYTPDVSFSSAAHDGYFACMAAISAGLRRHKFRLHRVLRDLGGSSQHGWRGRTARSEAGGRARQPQSRAIPNGIRLSTVFHDVTAASSGVSGCMSVRPACATTAFRTPVEMARRLVSRGDRIRRSNRPRVTQRREFPGILHDNHFATPLLRDYRRSRECYARATTANTSAITVTPPTFHRQHNSDGFHHIQSRRRSVSAHIELRFHQPGQHQSTSAGAATLTIYTTASQQSTCTAANQMPRGIPRYARMARF